jgi:hypothetical protein
MPTILLENAPDAPLRPHEREGLLDIVRRRRLVLVCLAAPPVITIAGALIAPRVLVYLIIVSMAAFAVSVLRHSVARCPRCGDFIKWMNPLTMECVACGLSLDKLRAGDESASARD